MSGSNTDEGVAKDKVFAQTGNRIGNPGEKPDTVSTKRFQTIVKLNQGNPPMYRVIWWTDGIVVSVLVLEPEFLWFDSQFSFSQNFHWF